MTSIQVERPTQHAPSPGGDLTTRARSLSRRLDALYAVHGLSRRELLAVQRGILQLHRAGAAPSANEFWEMTALPRSQVLKAVATAAIDHELDGIADDLDGRWPAGSDPARLLLAALPSLDPIDELGRWWQRRLRRAATLRALPLIALSAPSQAELVIANVEMSLLDRAPWSHGDRLLSAFETAHAEVISHGRRRVGGLAGLLPARWP